MEENLVRAFRWAARGVGTALDHVGLRAGVGTLTGGLRNAVGRKRRQAVPLCPGSDRDGPSHDSRAA
ncbi:hypothetical protein OG333_22145 [Streptomyces anulatus]|uniref:hypothetical protein n=1 Tax=Streptomyces anulatus TaxID=1892 RepID=UPI00386999F1|nr:hypothetical protein OG333_22145 [Streptomyces anulatus]